MSYCNVILRGAVKQTDVLYTYKIPETLEGKVVPGCLCSVPFGKGNRLKTALVTEVTAECSSNYKVKDVSGLVSDLPVVTDDQLAILDKFVKAKKPVLGICRGEQLINVYFGGSLIQHVAGHAGIYHDVKNVSGSIMYRLYGKTTKVYSSHHQAVRRLGKGLKITQKANDGTVEAIEHKTLPIFAVQWHPELMGKSGQPVLKEFLTQCKSHRKAG